MRTVPVLTLPPRITVQTTGVPTIGTELPSRTRATSGAMVLPALSPWRLPLNAWIEAGAAFTLVALKVAKVPVPAMVAVMVSLLGDGPST